MCALAARLTLSRSPTPADRVLPLPLRHKGRSHAPVIRPLRILKAGDRSMVAATAAGGLERDVSPGLLHRRRRLPVCVTDVLHTGDPPPAPRAGDWPRLRAPVASDIVGTRRRVRAPRTREHLCGGTGPPGARTGACAGRYSRAAVTSWRLRCGRRGCGRNRGAAAARAHTLGDPEYAHSVMRRRKVRK